MARPALAGPPPSPAQAPPHGPGGHAPLQPHHLGVRMDATRPSRRPTEAGHLLLRRLLPQVAEEAGPGGAKAGSHPTPWPFGPCFLTCQVRKIPN